MRKRLEKWYVWLLLAVVFLVTVQVLFTIPAPCKWLDAVWEAGDLISFVGTLVLGYIAVKQTQQANEVAKSANDTSQKLIELQQKEYLPTILVDAFVGLTKHKLTPASDELKTSVGITECRTDDEVSLGVFLSVVDENFDIKKEIYCRDYEFHFKYTGKFLIKDVRIISMGFEGADYSKKFNINCSLGMSLSASEEFRLLMFCVSNHDFLQPDNEGYKWIKASKLILVFEMETMDGEVYQQTTRVMKHLVIEPEKQFNRANIELPVAVSYDVVEL